MRLVMSDLANALVYRSETNRTIMHKSYMELVFEHKFVGQEIRPRSKFANVHAANANARTPLA